MDKLDKY